MTLPKSAGASLTGTTPGRVPGSATIFVRKIAACPETTQRKRAFPAAQASEKPRNVQIADDLTERAPEWPAFCAAPRRSPRIGVHGPRRISRLSLRWSTALQRAVSGTQEQ